ncbi:hypothetical protein R1flu_000752 [Riccia fluitans]|uniref:Uncharacterized protein n=1 Tax=Riccia fluitans TaxID=41844 RepID=A0ABD1Y1D6_9MARC
MRCKSEPSLHRYRRFHRLDDGMANDECLKIWMESEVNCDAAQELRSDSMKINNTLPLAEDVGLMENMMHLEVPSPVLESGPLLP